MHRPSAEKLWQIPDSTAFPMLPAFPFRPTPLEVQATSYLAPSVNIFSFSCMLKFSWISILNFPSLNKYAGSPFPPSVWFGCQAHSHICQHLCSGSKNVCSVFLFYHRFVIFSTPFRTFVYYHLFTNYFPCILFAAQKGNAAKPRTYTISGGNIPEWYTIYRASAQLCNIPFLLLKSEEFRNAR